MMILDFQITERFHRERFPHHYRDQSSGDFIGLAGLSISRQQKKMIAKFANC